MKKLLTVTEGHISVLKNTIESCNKGVIHPSVELYKTQPEDFNFLDRIGSVAGTDGVKWWYEKCKRKLKPYYGMNFLDGYSDLLVDWHKTKEIPSINDYLHVIKYYAVWTKIFFFCFIYLIFLRYHP